MLEEIGYLKDVKIGFKTDVCSLLQWENYYLETMDFLLALLPYGNLASLALESQPAFNCSKLTIEILEQGVKYVQN